MKEKIIFDNIINTIEILQSIIENRNWELFQELIVETPAKEEELKNIETIISINIPLEFRKLLKFSKHLKFSYQYEEVMPIEFRENFSGHVCWDLNKIPSLTNFYKDWLNASLDPKYNDESAIAITQEVGIDKFPFLEVSNGDLIVMDKTTSEIVYLSHEGSNMHGKKLGNNLWEFLEFHTKIGFAGPEDWQFEPFYDFEMEKMNLEGEKVKKFSNWLFTQ